MIRAPALVGVLAAAYGAVKGRGGSDSADAARTEAGRLALIVSHRLQIPFYKRAGFPRNPANVRGRLVKSRRERSMR
jgi:hypothetical protein